jgi:hypothetical protein
MTEEELKRVANLERQVDAINKQMMIIIKSVDAAARRLGLAPVLDDQLLSIDARSGMRAERH